MPAPTNDTSEVEVSGTTERGLLAGAPSRIGRYELLERIGVGGTAEAYRARVRGPEGFEKIVVLKRILPRLASDPAFVRLLVSEAKVTAALHHANIVHVFELGHEDGEWFIAMEYVEGTDLLKTLRACAATGTRPDPGLVAFVVAELAKALDYAHTATNADGRPLRIVHRDVSPSNVLVSRHGDVKLMDFGVAYAELDHAFGPGGLDDSPPGGLSDLRGKLGYMAPELLSGRGVDARADLFALGVLLFEGVTLKRLFAGRTAAETVRNVLSCDVESRLARHSEIPPWLLPILRRSLARDPDRRHGSAAEVQEDLLDALFEARVRVSKQKLCDLLSGVGALAPKKDAGGGAGPATLPGKPPAPAATLPAPAPKPVPAPEPEAAQEAEEWLVGAVFRLRTDDGQTFGPITWTNLTNLLKNHAISPRELVSVDGGEWVTVEEVTGIRVVEPELFADLSGKPLWEGRLDPLSMPAILLALAEHRLTGKLALLQDRVLKQVWVDGGDPVHVSSNRKEELLGPFLAARGAVDDDDVRRAARYAKAAGGFLGDALVHVGALDAHELFRHLEDQLREKLLELFRWRDGWFAFYRGVPPPEGMPLMRHEMRPLVAEGVRAHFTAGELRQHFDGRTHLAVHLDPSRRLLHHDLRLDPRETRFAALLQDGATLREVGELYAAWAGDRAVLHRVAFLLEALESLSLGGA